MAKKAYIGVGGVARKVKKGYIGVGSAARKIKKAYIGIGGVARPCWSGGEVVYYGPATPLSSSRYLVGAAPAGDYALFAGGALEPTNNTAAVEAYDTALTRTLPTALYAARAGTAGVGNHGYAVFGGGTNASGTDCVTTVDAYNAQLTRSTPAALSIKQDHSTRGGAVGRYALIGLGYTLTATGYVKTVDAYSDTLTKSAAPEASQFHGQGGAAAVGGRLLFAGGDTNSATTDAVDVYDANLTRTTAPSLSYTDTVNCMSGSVGRYALFLGGAGSAVVNAYDEDLTRSIPEPLSAVRQRGGTATVQGCLICALGIGADGIALDTVEVYDEELTHTTGLNCSYAAGFVRGCAVGNFALFAGGYQGSARFSNVDAFTID